MTKMTLGAYTFEWNPDNYTIPNKTRVVGVQETYTSVAFFSWGTLLAGKEIELTWARMSVAQYNQLQTLVENDTQIVWNPQRGDAKTYNVQITDLTGKFMESSIDDAPYRDEVTLKLLIISEVA